MRPAGAAAGDNDPEPTRIAAEGEIGASRQRDAKCLPVQSPVEETEVRGVDINEDTARVEDG